MAILVAALFSYVLAEAGAQVTGEKIDLRMVSNAVRFRDQKLQSVSFDVKQVSIFFGGSAEHENYIWSCNQDKIITRKSTPVATFVNLYNDGKEETRTYDRGDERTGRLLQSDVTAMGGVTPLSAHPLVGTYLFKGKWLSKVIKDGSFTIRKGEINPQFGTTYVLEGTGAENIRYEVTLASERGWAGIKSRMIQEKEDKHTEITSQVKSLQEVDGIYLPSKVEFDIKSRLKTQMELVSLVHKVVSSKVLRLNDIPDSYFVLPRLSDGATVVDSDTFIRYKQQSGKLVAKNVPLVARQNIWRWVFTVASAIAVFSVAIYSVRRWQQSKAS